jgi:hypothetical protein
MTSTSKRTLLLRIVASWAGIGLLAAVFASTSAEAMAAPTCRGLTGWGRYNCLGQRYPRKYLLCSERATELGHSNMAPGRASFIMSCIIKLNQAQCMRERCSRR